MTTKIQAYCRFFNKKKHNCIITTKIQAQHRLFNKKTQHKHIKININATLKQKDQKPNSPQVCSNLQRNVTNKQIGNNIKTKGATTTSLNKVEELFADCQKCNIVLLSDLFLLFVCCSFLSVPHLVS